MSPPEVLSPRVFALYVYPLKGARAVALERSDVLAQGLRHDRRFMLLDAHGRFVTQREHPRMALVEVAIEGDHLRLNIAGSAAESATVPLHHADLAHRPHRHATVWGDEVDALDVGGEGAELLSEHLRESCSLVFMPPDAIRLVDPDYGAPGDRVGFADGFPLLVASLASLAELNGRMLEHGATSITIDRFRANIVVDGGEPHEEESGARMKVGAITLRTPKRCSRCQVITVDQHSAVAGKEPLRTLATYRREGNKVYFGINAIPELVLEETASIAIGDPVTFGL